LLEAALLQRYHFFPITFVASTKTSDITQFDWHFWQPQGDFQRDISRKLDISQLGVLSVLKKMRKLDKWRTKEAALGLKNNVQQMNSL